MPGHAIEINARDNLGMTPLMLAAYAGHLPMVSHLLGQGADHTSQNQKSDTALSLACKTGNQAIVEVLLQAEPISFDHFDDDGETLLTSAIHASHLGTVKRLLATGKFEVEAKCMGGTPLLQAVSRGQLEICRVLLEKGWANVNGISWIYGCYISPMVSMELIKYQSTTPLITAVDVGAWGVTKLLLGRDDIQVDLRDGRGYSALHVAAEKKTPKWVDLLIDDMSADVTACTEQGLTPLFLACFSSSLEVVDVLLAAKDIEPDARDLDGRSVLSRFAGQDCSESVCRFKIMDRLLATGRVDVNSQDYRGRTPLHHAVQMGNIDTVEYLLRIKGIDLDIIDDDGHDAVAALIPVICKEARMSAHELSQSERPDKAQSLCRQQLKLAAILTMGFEAPSSDILDFLEASQSDFDDWLSFSSKDAGSVPYGDYERRMRCKNWRPVARYLLGMVKTEFDWRTTGQGVDDRPALVFACESEASSEMVRELLALGASVNAQDGRGISPLSSAVVNGDIFIIEDLLKAGADLEAKDHLGRTALGSIGKATKPGVVRLLLEHGAYIHTKDLRGETPLLKAFGCKESGHTVSMLLKAGARVADRDEEGHDVVWHAQQGPATKKRRRMIRMLQRKLHKHASKKRKLILTMAARPKQDRRPGFRRQIIRTPWKWTARPTMKRRQGIVVRMLKATLEELGSQGFEIETVMVMGI